MNIEQICKDTITVVERYLDSNVVVHYADIFAALCEAQDAVDKAWDESSSRKSDRMCWLAWYACDTAKNDECDIAKESIKEFWENV
tara:strand:+ start:470 stop:727 length:258 start_codon:yes stop_codon:yes gene_type:complete